MTIQPAQRAASMPLEPILAQGTIEKVFPTEQACTERARFAKLDGWLPGADGGFAMKRGIITGALAEHELVSFARGHGLTIDLGRIVDAIIAETRIGPGLADRIPEMRAEAVSFVRKWQEGFPFADGDLDWVEVENLLLPQTDLFVRRKGRFSIRVRPDNVVGVDDTLVAVEWTTAKNPKSVSPARFALNHYALLRERQRRPEWQRFQAVATRVELLALGEGFTIRLDAEEADRWRLAIGSAAEDLLASRYKKSIGPWCSTCPWQGSCWFGEEGGEDTPF